MTEHTKLPWRLNNYHHPHLFIVAEYGPDDNDAFPGTREICAIRNNNTKANAEFIVKACNSHTANLKKIEGLVDALKRVVASMDTDAVLGTGEWQKGMFCGLEDRGITDRYDACIYGYEKALERVGDWVTGHIEAALAQAKEGS